MPSRLAVVLALALFAPLGPLGVGPAEDLPAPRLAEVPADGWQVARHVDTASQELYVAETLTSMRWSTGATQERWWGRPFWVEPVTGRGVRVAVVDTGIDPTHPDLDGRIAAWKDFIHARPTPYDDDTHGTHVAGIIAAGGHLQLRPDQHYFPFGARGLAPGADLLIAKAMDRDGDGDATHVAKAILWALDPNGDGDYRDGAHIINLSIGLETPPTDDGVVIPGPITLPSLAPRTPQEEALVRDAITTAVRAGAVVVVAAGNHEAGQNGAVTFPGTMPEVITVGALDPDGSAASFSNVGAAGSGKPDLAAPGVLLSTFPRGRDDTDSARDGYVALGGTSMAAPVVSGAIALLMEADPSLRGLSRTEDRSGNTERVRSVLIDTARPVGAGFNTVYGHGVLQVQQAVDAVDDGRGPPNWDVLLLIGLLATAIGLLVWRRRARRAQTRRRKAEAATGDLLADEVPLAAATGPPSDQRPPWTH